MTNALIASIEARIAAAHAVPKTHAAVITYSDGSKHTVEHTSAASAETSLRAHRPLIGTHEYISRRTDKKITIVSCDVVAL